MPVRGEVLPDVCDEMLPVAGRGVLSIVVEYTVGAALLLDGRRTLAVDVGRGVIVIAAEYTTDAARLLDSREPVAAAELAAAVVVVERTVKVTVLVCVELMLVEEDLVTVTRVLGGQAGVSRTVEGDAGVEDVPTA